MYLVLFCSLITLFVTGGIALYGIFDIKKESTAISREIGETAAKNSSQILRKFAVESLQGLTHERAKQIDNFFLNMKWGVIAMSNEMNLILRNPQNYSPRPVSEPDRNNKGVLIPQLQYRAGVNRDALAYEVGLTANLQDLQIRLFDEDPTLASNYVTSVNGFNIVTDRVSETRVDENNNPFPNDFSIRPWYRAAFEKKELIFTDIFVDSQGRGFAVACAAPYYNPDGEIAGIVGEGVILAEINGIVRNTRMGETGYAFVMNNETGKILFAPQDDGTLSIDGDDNLENDPSLFNDKNPDVVQTAKNMAAGKTGIDLVKDLDGKNCYIAYTPLLEVTHWSFGVVIEEREVTEPAEVNETMIEKSTAHFVTVLNDSIKFMIVAMIFAFIAIISLIPFFGRKIADMFTKPIHLLADGVRDIAAGDLDKKIEINTGNEIEHLAVCFNAMTDELKKQMQNLETVTAEKERIATELNVATNIQQAMLPKDFDFDRKDFEIFATMHAAKEVGGDFYDFYMLDENHLVVTIADVSGKGVPAALFMVIAKTVLKNFAMTMTDPDDFAAVMACANDQLCQNNDEMMFVTVFFGMLDIKTGEFIFVNGGHNPPLIYRKAEDKFEYLEVKKNFVLGGMDGMNFVQQSIKLEKDDIIYMYTDGVTEALDNEKELYGEERLLDCLDSSDKNISLSDLLAYVRKDLDKHVDGAEQSDDITMLALRLRKE